jgi:XTP/dITP diphosphohydrolase
VTELLALLRTLRGPGGCPWDRAQTHQSLIPYLLEEAGEAADALALGRRGAVIEELGDLLLQIGLHAVIAEESGNFTYADVEGGICRKMVRRHPHVFGGEELPSDVAALRARWRTIKEQESKESDPPPRYLTALQREQRAQRLRKDAAQGRSEAAQRVQEASPDPQGVASALRAVVSWAQSLGIDAETALRGAQLGES